MIEMNIDTFTFDPSLPQEKAAWRCESVTLAQLCASAASSATFTIALLDDDHYATYVSADNRKRLADAFHIPTYHWDTMYQDACGFWWAGEQCQGERQAYRGRECEMYTTSCRFLIKHYKPSLPSSQCAHAPSKRPPVGVAEYDWQKLWLVNSWRLKGGSVLLCFTSSVHSVKQSIQARLNDRLNPVRVKSNGELQTLMLNLSVIPSFDKSVWSWRDRVRELEKDRPKNDESHHYYESRHSYERGHNYEHMHDLARHIVHSSESLDMALSVIRDMAEEYRKSRPEILLDLYEPNYERNLMSVMSMLKCIHGRSEALGHRLRNELNLMFHITTQRDTSNSFRIAEAARKDGRVMKGISILGMIFLPGTFVSAIFSMSFFHFGGADQNQWTVTSEFWVFWAVAIPLTALTLVVWQIWLQAGDKRTPKFRSETWSSNISKV